jgi:hypothetical protein
LIAVCAQTRKKTAGKHRENELNAGAWLKILLVVYPLLVLR